MILNQAILRQISRLAEELLYQGFYFFCLLLVEKNRISWQYQKQHLFLREETCCFG